MLLRPIDNQIPDLSNLWVVYFLGLRRFCYGYTDLIFIALGIKQRSGEYFNAMVTVFCQ